MPCACSWHHTKTYRGLATMIAASQDLLKKDGANTFSTVLADPPWQFQNRTGKMAPEHKRLNRYGTMTLPEDILSLPVANIVEETAHLYLWVPNAMLPDGLAVLAAWGFLTNQILSGTKSVKTEGRTEEGLVFISEIQLNLFCLVFGQELPERCARPEPSQHHPNS